ncbi:MAG: hypothetical protein ACXQS8_06495 [Candidatus Helarchaeales archaeon]
MLEVDALNDSKKWYLGIPAVGAALNLIGAEMFVRLKWFFLIPSMGFFPFDYHVALFAAYFIYFMFLSYLINHLHFGMREIFITGIAYGTFMEFFWTQSIAGMSWQAYLLNWLVLPFTWWAVIQTALFYYISYSLIKPEKKSREKNDHFILLIFVLYLLISLGVARIITPPIVDLNGAIFSIFIINECFLFLIGKFDSYSSINRNSDEFASDDDVLKCMGYFIILASIAFTIASFFIPDEPFISCIGTMLSPIGTEAASETYFVAAFIMICNCFYKRD